MTHDEEEQRGGNTEACGPLEPVGPGEEEQGLLQGPSQTGHPTGN